MICRKSFLPSVMVYNWSFSFNFIFENPSYIMRKSYSPEYLFLFLISFVFVFCFLGKDLVVNKIIIDNRMGSSPNFSSNIEWHRDCVTSIIPETKNQMAAVLYLRLICNMYNKPPSVIVGVVVFIFMTKCLFFMFNCSSGFLLPVLLFSAM